MDSITFDKYGTTFEVGKIYENALGSYEVKKIEDGKLFVRYLSIKNAVVNLYTEYKYDAEGQAQSLYKMRQEHLRPSLKRIHKRLQNLPKVSDKHAFTLGYIAANGHIQIEVGPNSIETFPLDFENVTGFKVSQFEGRGYAASPTYNKFAYSMTLRLPKSSEDILHLMDLPQNIQKKDSGVFIHNNDFGWGLLHAGFLPGSNWGNGNRILSKLPNEKEEDFDKGFDYEKQKA